MRIKKQLIKEVDDMILKNDLRHDGSFEIIACGDIKNIDIVFGVNGEGATQKGFAVWERFDENFDADSFVNKVLILLSNSFRANGYAVTDGGYLYFREWNDDYAVIVIDDQPGNLAEAKHFESFQEAQEVANILDWRVERVCN